MLKAAIKHGAGEDQVRHRIVPPEVVSKWSEKLDNLKGEISAVLAEEKEERQVCCLDLCFRTLLISYKVPQGRNGAKKG